MQFVHPTYARLLCAVLRGRGVEVADALAGTGMTWAQLSNEEGFVTFDQMRRLIRRAIELTGSPALGLELAPAAQPSAHGPVGYAAVASSNLEQALEVVAQYGAVRVHGLEFRLAADRNFAKLSIHEQFDLGDVRIFVLEAMLVTLMGLLEALTGQPLDRAECLLPYPAPAWAPEYTRYVKAKVRFGAACLEIRLPRGLLETPCLTADAGVCASARRECERSLAEDSGVAQRVRLRLLTREGDYPALPAVARDLHMSPRTLIRKLKQEGASFQELLDEVRKERAAWYFSQTNEPVEIIAERLGYADTSNFSRTCRRWFGATARELRQRG